MIAEATWNPEARAITSRLSGTVTAMGVAQWIAQLDAALAAVPPGTELVLLDDQVGYEPADGNVYEMVNAVLPEALARHGFRSVLAGDLPLAEAPPSTFSKVAHVHHDAARMTAFEARLGTVRERFFSDAAPACAWLIFG